VLAISKRSELGLNAAELVEADCLELDAVQKVVAGDEGVASLIEKKTVLNRSINRYNRMQSNDLLSEPLCYVAWSTCVSSLITQKPDLLIKKNLHFYGHLA